MVATKVPRKVRVYEIELKDNPIRFLYHAENYTIEDNKFYMYIFDVPEVENRWLVLFKPVITEGKEELLPQYLTDIWLESYIGFYLIDSQEAYFELCYRGLPHFTDCFYNHNVEVKDLNSGEYTILGELISQKLLENFDFICSRILESFNEPW